MAVRPTVGTSPKVDGRRCLRARRTSFPQAAPAALSELVVWRPLGLPPQALRLLGLQAAARPSLAVPAAAVRHAGKTSTASLSSNTQR
ncbi:MAG TPA: hypothetical protein VHB79_36145 [Polyangiaceae bacterium]|nr:hypothetical protein [Polyangiaceae bacterium]